jgi:hypothetical protein
MSKPTDADLEVAGLPRGLGWFGVGLGIAQLAAPDVINCLIGVQPTEDNRRMLRASGKKELAAGLKILTKGRRSGAWLADVTGVQPGRPSLAGPAQTPATATVAAR